MKKLKQLSLILFLSIGLFSCEAEKADADITNEYLQGKQIFRCTVDGVTRVTDSVVVTSNGANVSLTAYLLSVDPEQARLYKYDTFTLTFSKLATGNYISSIEDLLATDLVGITNSSYKISGKSWAYSTQNAELNFDSDNIQDYLNMNLQIGSLSIDSINDKAKYFEGGFQYDVYAPKNQNPNNTLAPIKIRNGYFQYIKFN